MTPIVFQWLIRSAFFMVIAVPTCLYAWRSGGQPERLTALMIALAVVGTTITSTDRFVHVVWALAAVDVALLIGIVAIALAADRYWPMYFAAVHLLSVALHGVRAYDHLILPMVYARLGGEIGYITLALLALGTWRHERRAPEADWTWQIPR